MKKLIITCTECYKGNATHGSHQHQAVLINENTVIPFFLFENGPSDSDREMWTLNEIELSDDQFNELIEYKNEYFETINKISTPRLDGGIEWSYKKIIESFDNKFKSEKKEALKQYQDAMRALFELSKATDPFIKSIKLDYCCKVFKAVDSLEDFDYFKSIFY